MYLDESGKKEIRELIEEQVKKIPDGQRLKLKKAILEELIFHKIAWSTETKNSIPIWTGPFLRKLDLSELNFSNVFFDFESFEESCLTNNGTLDDIKYKIKPFDFSYTNANIKLSNSIKNTIYSNCNFEGMDFSNETLNLDNFVDYNGNINSIVYKKNNFKNTKIRIYTDRGRILSMPSGSRESLSKNEYHQKVEVARENIKKMIEEGYFDGCYIDGYLIRDGKITKINLSDMVLEQNRRELIDYILTEVDKHIKEYNKENGKIQK